MTAPATPSEANRKTNALLLLMVFNQASWSTLHVASRYLQVYAQPVKFDGLGLLASAKGSAAVFLFIGGTVQDLWLHRRSHGVVCSGDDDDARSSELPPLHPAANNDSSEAGTSTLECNSSDAAPGDTAARAPNRSQQPQTTAHAPTPVNDGMDEMVLQRTKLAYMLLFALVSTTRASTNIASSKYTYPYNISE